MASLKTSEALIDELAAELKQLGEDANGSLGQKLLDAGAEVYKKSWVSSIKKHGHIDTGDMMNSIGVAPGTKNKKYRDIYPLGKDRKGVRNTEKAFVLNYGRSNLLGSRFVEEAVSDAENECISVMQDTLDRHISGSGL